MQIVMNESNYIKNVTHNTTPKGSGMKKLLAQITLKMSSACKIKKVK